MHWYYTWSICQQHKKEYYNNCIENYCTVPPVLHLQHPDSNKYFTKCNPANEPVLSVFNNHHQLWPLYPAAEGTPSSTSSTGGGRQYHGTLPLGDNSLTTRLITQLLISLTKYKGLNMDKYFSENYLALFTPSSPSFEPTAPATSIKTISPTPGSPISSLSNPPSSSTSPCSTPLHNDTWIDETHRIFFRNLSKGAYPYEAGMDDVCLTGLGISTPILFTYMGSRTVTETSLRTLLQITHKAEDMVQQCLWYGDLLQSIFAKYTEEPPNIPSRLTKPIVPSIQSLFVNVFETFSNGRLFLPEILARNLTDEQAYHGDTVIFSSR